MKRPGDVPCGEVDLESARREYKKARKAYKLDKSDEELKRAKSEAKKALKEAEAAETKRNLSSESTNQSVVTSSEKENTEDSSKDGCDGDNDGSDGKDDTNAAPTIDIEALEESYQNALAAFKANKADKDLRRAKTAARRALDDAITTSTDGKQLVCVACSKKFIFSTAEQEKHESKGWNESPTRCEPCRDARIERLSDVRSRMDSKKKNMCYAFQRGECLHGASCKFSHNPEHGGKRSGGTDGKEDEASNGDVSEEKMSEEKKSEEKKSEEKKSEENSEEKESKERKSKERKEQGLRKKGKGWRNK